MDINTLNQFLSKGEDPAGLHNLFSDREYVYATNRHIAVRVPASHFPGVHHQNEKLPKIKEVFAGCEALTYTPPDIQLPPDVTCSLCHGLGKVWECDHCEGHGEFTHLGFEYDCKNCAGTGGIAGLYLEEGMVYCHLCDGFGSAFQAVKVRNSSFNRKYLALILSIDGMKLCVKDAESPTFFSFPDGYGAIMPVRV